MGLFPSKLSAAHAELLSSATGMTIDEISPRLDKIPVYVYSDRRQFHKHTTPDSVAFLVILGQYIVSTKSTFGGKKTYHRHI